MLNVKTSVARARAVLSVLLLAVSLSAAAGAPLDIKTWADAVDGHYNHLKSLQADFSELYRGSGMERTETGTLWLKKTGKMRWEYRSPTEKLFVSNGKDAWFYVPADGQARRTASKNLEDARSPLAFLLGKAKLQKELRGLSLAPDMAPLQPEDVVVRGVPMALADRISEILLEVNPQHQIGRIIVQGVDGSTTEYRFSNQKEDVPVSDARFEFHPPSGTETVEGELGQ